MAITRSSTRGLNRATVTASAASETERAKPKNAAKPKRKASGSSRKKLPKVKVKTKTVTVKVPVVAQPIQSSGSQNETAFQMISIPTDVVYRLNASTMRHFTVVDDGVKVEDSIGQEPIQKDLTSHSSTEPVSTQQFVEGILSADEVNVRPATSLQHLEIPKEEPSSVNLHSTVEYNGMTQDSTEIWSSEMASTEWDRELVKVEDVLLTNKSLSDSIVSISSNSSSNVEQVDAVWPIDFQASRSRPASVFVKEESQSPPMETNVEPLADVTEQLLECDSAFRSCCHLSDDQDVCMHSVENSPANRPRSDNTETSSINIFTPIDGTVCFPVPHETPEQMEESESEYEREDQASQKSEVQSNFLLLPGPTVQWWSPAETAVRDERLSPASKVVKCESPARTVECLSLNRDVIRGKCWSPAETLIKDECVSPTPTEIYDEHPSPARTIMKDECVSPTRTEIYDEHPSPARTIVKDECVSPTRTEIYDEHASPARTIMKDEWFVDNTESNEKLQDLTNVRTSEYRPVASSSKTNFRKHPRNRERENDLETWLAESAVAYHAERTTDNRRSNYSSNHLDADCENNSSRQNHLSGTNAANTDDNFDCNSAAFPEFRRTHRKRQRLSNELDSEDRHASRQLESKMKRCSNESETGEKISSSTGEKRILVSNWSAIRFSMSPETIGNETDDSEPDYGWEDPPPPKPQPPKREGTSKSSLDDLDPSIKEKMEKLNDKLKNDYDLDAIDAVRKELFQGIHESIKKASKMKLAELDRKIQQKKDEYIVKLLGTTNFDSWDDDPALSSA